MVSDDSFADDELYQAVKLIVFRMHLDYGKPQPTMDYLIGMSMSWRDHLKAQGIPAQDVGLLYAETVAAKARTNGAAYMPVVGDLLHEWDAWLENGYWEKQNAPEPLEHLPALPAGENPLPGGINTDAAPKFVQVFAESLRRGGEQVCCGCKGAKGEKIVARLTGSQWGRFWTCGLNKCEFSVKIEDMLTLLPDKAASTPSAANDAPKEPRREYSDAEILSTLSDSCGFDVPNEKRDYWLDFARHLETQVPPSVWTRPVASKIYQKWQSEQPAEVTA